MNSNVFVIGTGIISAAGNSPDVVYKNLLDGKSLLSRMNVLESNSTNGLLVGKVSASNEELIAELGLQVGYPYSRTMLLGLFAATQAVNDSKISKRHLARALFISANTVGGMDKTEQYFSQNQGSFTTEIVDILKQHDCGSSTEFIANTLGLGGLFTSISTACSSSANSIMLGARMIKSGRADIVVAGGTDGLCNFTLKGFNSLMLLSNQPCKPFDQQRNGLNLGEGAAYVVLCSEKIAHEYSVKAELAGWGNTNDAYHQTASSPEGRGASQAMIEALKVAGITCEKVSYINAHGTATPNNDLAEAQAILSVFASPPRFSSTKPFTGHTLGAAGAIEAVISILSIQYGTIFSSLYFKETMMETGLAPVTETLHSKIDYVLSNSFGFGGNCSSLLFKASNV